MKKTFLLISFVACSVLGFAQQPNLVHYWHFNNLPSGPLDSLRADVSLLVDSGTISYPGTGDGYLDRNSGDGSTANARNGEPAGNSLRARNPSDTRDLIITLPTTGFENPIFSYEVYRSNSGQLQNLVYYTVDGSTYTFIDTIDVTTNYATHIFDFDTIAAADNNPAFGIKIAFEGQHTGTSGNNRMDNFTLEAAALAPIVTQEVTFDVVDANGPVTSATVSIAGSSQTTNAIGRAVFTVVQGATTYSVQRGGYTAVSNVPITIAADTTIIVTLQQLGQSVLHYWHFNDLQLVNGQVDSIATDYSISGLADGLLYYAGMSSGYMDDYNPGSSLNTQLQFPAGDALRVRNRSEGRSLVFEMPTTDCEDLVFVFDVHRSGSGMLENNIAYTIDGTAFITTGLTNTVIAITESYTTEVVDFTQVAGVNNNPNFAIRITYSGNTEQENGNNRYDNIALLGTPTNGLGTTTPLVLSGATLYPNPVSDVLQLHLPLAMRGSYTAVVRNSQGAVIGHYQVRQGEHTIDCSNLTSGLYILTIQGEKGVQTLKFVKI